MASEEDVEAETIYERVARLEDEVAKMRYEINTMKKALKNTIARHEIEEIKRGKDITSILE